MTETMTLAKNDAAFAYYWDAFVSGKKATRIVKDLFGELRQEGDVYQAARAFDEKGEFTRVCFTINWVTVSRFSQTP